MYMQQTENDNGTKTFNEINSDQEQVNSVVDEQEENKKFFVYAEEAHENI
jgi:hypothetical protein